MSELVSEIEELLVSNGIEFSKFRCGRFAAFSCAGVVILPEPVSANTLEEAGRLNGDFLNAVRTVAPASSAAPVGSVALVSSVAPGRKLVIVPEDFWRSRPEMLKPRLLSQLGIFRSVFARNTVVRRIARTEAADFLNRWHTYGDAASRYRYGLFDGTGQLVAVSAFSSGRKWEKESGTVRSYEWVRYASLPDVRVVGGMGKMLKAFIEDVRPDDVMSYADLEWTDGSVYEKLGFVLESRRPEVAFAVDRKTWRRTALSSQIPVPQDVFCHINLGSGKYRLRLGGPVD